jgi:hypothetical protein
VGRRSRVDSDSFNMTGAQWVVEVRAATRSIVGQQWRAGKARRSTEGGRRAAADLGRRRGRKVLGFGWLPLLFISILVRVVESKMNGQDQLGYLG